MQKQLHGIRQIHKPNKKKRPKTKNIGKPEDKYKMDQATDYCSVYESTED